MNETLRTIWATGRRKTTVARVKLLIPGEGKVIINHRPIDKYFGNHQRHKATLLYPLKVVPNLGKLDIYVNVVSGGVTGQAGAIRHGISRALSKVSPEIEAALRKHRLLGRDPRMVERKKPGQPKARKKFQWSKR